MKFEETKNLLVQNSRAEHMGKTANNAINVAEEPEKSTENVAYPL
jgi:hypothetical protein